MQTGFFGSCEDGNGEKLEKNENIKISESPYRITDKAFFIIFQ